jgi:group I intron endonuclease
MNTGIYKFRNLIDEKLYVGSTGDRRGFNCRWKVHLRLLRQNKHHSSKLQNAYNKYGEDNFICEVVEVIIRVESPIIFRKYLKERERYYIQLWKPAYNMNDVSESNLGYKHSEETRKKNSEAQKGKKHSQETLLKMSKAQKGRTHTESTKQKLKQINQGRQNTWQKGIPRTEEVRQKIIENIKGKCSGFIGKHTEQTKIKLSKIHKGKTTWMKGKKHSEESLRKMSESHKNSHVKKREV